tara:strand:+ start:90 stop:281 length:192 start_codon:yes stop_codon:yes gene_type:complete
MPMQIGDLVEVLRSRDLATSGSIGVLCKRWTPSPGFEERTIWAVQLLDGQQLRYLQKDLKKIN